MAVKRSGIYISNLHRTSTHHRVKVDLKAKTITWLESSVKNRIGRTYELGDMNEKDWILDEITTVKQILKAYEV